MRKVILRAGLVCDAIAVGLAIYGAANGLWWLTGGACIWLAGDVVAVYILIKRQL